MKVLLCIASLLALSAAQEATACAKCLHPVWYNAVNTYETAAQRCAAISVEDVMSCLDTCDLTPADKPISYRIRQLTQISDVFYALLANNCTVDPLTGADGKCDAMMKCVLSVSNYEYEGRTDYSFFSTVFDYMCRVETTAAALSCLHIPANQCVTADRLNTLSSVLTLGIEAACYEPRRCVKYGNIFEVKPGTQCNEYYQEAAAYGPSIGQSLKTPDGEGFNPAICNRDFLNNFVCPADPASVPIYSELPPAQPTPMTKKVVYEQITVNTSLPCEQCLEPLWYRAVTTNGSHLCDASFQSSIYECLANCQCCPGCEACPGRYEQLNTEVLVKLADISKALQLNSCSGNPSCTSESYTCTDNVALFYPSSAPHVTVNSLSCRNEDLGATIACFARTCNADVADILSSAAIAGYDPICMTDTRCLTYGNIYELVPMSELEGTVEGTYQPCEHFKHSPVHGWFPPVGVNRVQAGYLFNTIGCWPDYPRNVICPTEISAADPMLISN